MPALDEVVGHGHEELRLVGVEAEGDDPVPRAPLTARAATSARPSSRTGRGRDEPDAGRDLGRRPASSPGFGQPGAGARLEPSLRLAQLVLEGGDAVRDGVDRLGADGRGGSLEGVEALADERVRGDAR